MLKKGVIIRHLVLPGQLEAAKEVMDWVSEQFRPDVYKRQVPSSSRSRMSRFSRAFMLPVSSPIRMPVPSNRAERV